MTLCAFGDLTVYHFVEFSTIFVVSFFVIIIRVRILVTVGCM